MGPKLAPSTPAFSMLASTLDSKLGFLSIGLQFEATGSLNAHVTLLWLPVLWASYSQDSTILANITNVSTLLSEPEF